MVEDIKVTVDLDELLRLQIAKEVWDYQECGPNFERPRTPMQELLKQTCIDQAERIRNLIIQSPLVYSMVVDHIDQTQAKEPLDKPNTMLYDKKSVVPIDRTEWHTLVYLFREFVIKHAKVWAMGAGSHHHPMWAMLAIHLDGFEAPHLTSGPYYEFIRADNTMDLSRLLEGFDSKKFNGLHPDTNALIFEDGSSRQPGIDPATKQYSTAQMLFDEKHGGDTSQPLFD